ncbi:MAG: metallophosphoesterase [Anaerolineae bacterium]|nr:metallophosphoesterase [Anaerolineae bacterium]
MKILAVSDRVVKSIYSAYIRERFADVDMVLSCGDLPYSYLEFIVSMLNVPCFFVHGNHDQPEYQSDGCVLTAPGGWVDLDGRTVRSKGITLAGLEGSIRYKPEGEYQYTEAQMAFKVRRMIPALLLNRLRYGRYLDVLITHSPPFHIHDGEDYCHRGFKALLWFMDRFRPRYLLHGHKHVYKPETCQTLYRDTQVINVYPFRTLDLDSAVGMKLGRKENGCQGNTA